MSLNVIHFLFLSGVIFVPVLLITGAFHYMFHYFKGIDQKLIGETLELKREESNEKCWIRVYSKPNTDNDKSIALVYDASDINIKNIRFYPPEYTEFVDTIKIKKMTTKRWIEVELPNGNIGYIDICGLDFNCLSILTEKRKNKGNILLGFEELKIRNFTFNTNFQKVNI